MFCIPRMRCEPRGAHWRTHTLIPSRRREPDGAHTHSGLAKLRFCVPRAKMRTRMVHTHAGLAKPRFAFAFPERDANPYGALACWAPKTYVLHSQNEMRTQRRTLDWFPMLCGPRTRWEPYGAHALGVLGTSVFAFPVRDTNRVVRTQSGLVKLETCTLRTRCEAYGAHCVTHSGFAKPRRKA